VEEIVLVWDRDPGYIDEVIQSLVTERHVVARGVTATNLGSTPQCSPGCRRRAENGS
jgi:hypothetical protein